LLIFQALSLHIYTCFTIGCREKKGEKKRKRKAESAEDSRHAHVTLVIL